MKYTKIKYVVAGFLENGEGKFLIAERPEGKPMSGYWEFPGGKIHENETPEIALVRELKEELGLDLCPEEISPLTFLTHGYDDFFLVMLLYRVQSRQKEPQPLENQNLAWVNFAKVREYKLLPADLPLVDFLEKLK